MFKRIIVAFVIAFDFTSAHAALPPDACAPPIPFPASPSAAATDLVQFTAINRSTSFSVQFWREPCPGAVTKSLIFGRFGPGADTCDKLEVVQNGIHYSAFTTNRFPSQDVAACLNSSGTPVTWLLEFDYRDPYWLNSEALSILYKGSVFAQVDMPKYVSSPLAAPKVPVIEYYHAQFDHYFITASPEEIALLDSGYFNGWSRVGLAFIAYANPTPISAPVCRFFSNSFGTKSSHFYTPDSGECEFVKSNPDWQFEATVFNAIRPDSNGVCPAGTIHVYRLYNNGQGGAPNHRYTPAPSVRDHMIALGWVPEGYGPEGVVMCTPFTYP